MKKKTLLTTILIILTVLFLAYWGVIYFLVSACLVPSFMEKLDAFEEITVKSYSEQVQSDYIHDNLVAANVRTKEWLSVVELKKEEIITDDGYRLVAACFGQNAESHKWVLLLHGYTGWKEEMYRFACDFYDKGYNCLVPDLRCQGESDGDFIGMGYADSLDCLKWIDYITDIDSEAEIVVMGQSMGAATALMMTGLELPANVKCVVSDCAYTDAYSMFGYKITDWFGLPAFPFVDSAVLMLKLRGGYDLRKASALDAVKQSNTPTLFIHGTKDAMIPYAMSEELYAAERADKEILIIEDSGHVQNQDKDPTRYYDTLWGFVGKYVE